MIRALSALTGRSWDSIYLEVVMEGFVQKDMPEMANVWGAVLKRNGYHRHIIPDTCPDCYTVSDFCKDHPTGNYLLSIPGSNAHVVAVVDGDHIDTWDSGDLIPQYYWHDGDEKGGAE